MRHFFSGIIFLALALVACTPNASPQEIAAQGESQAAVSSSGKARFLVSYATW